MKRYFETNRACTSGEKLYVMCGPDGGPNILDALFNNNCIGEYFKIYKDSGKICTDGSECEGACIADDKVEEISQFRNYEFKYPVNPNEIICPEKDFIGHCQNDSNPCVIKYYLKNKKVKENTLFCD